MTDTNYTLYLFKIIEIIVPFFYTSANSHCVYKVIKVIESCSTQKLHLSIYFYIFDEENVYKSAKESNSLRVDRVVHFLGQNLVCVLEHHSHN